jgi:hypothetical protein
MTSIKKTVIATNNFLPDFKMASKRVTFLMEYYYSEKGDKKATFAK